MKKLILFLAVIACTLSATAQDSLYINQKDGSIISYAIANVDSISFTRKTTTVTDYVIINGVKWATRNVNTPGTFVSSAEDYGYFYQWNSKVGWPSTGAIGSITATDGSTTWNSSWTGGYSTPSSSDTWTNVNDPSPTGYRVPTYTEIQSLLNTTYVTPTWTTQSGVHGERFTDNTTGNSIFLPASGYRISSGTLSSAGYGYYWSSTASSKSSDSNYFLIFSSSITGSGFGSRTYGQIIRPVVK